MNIKWILLVGLGMMLMTSCVQETIVIPEPLVTDADVYYEYAADNWGASIDGEIINDGETYINAVQLEVRLYDMRGYIIEYKYVWVDTYFHPGERVKFYLDYQQRGVYDVEVLINRYD